MKRTLIAIFAMLLIAAGFIAGLEWLGRWKGFQPETWSVLDNDLGYRMRAASFIPPAPQPLDLLLVGDSITYAQGQPQSFARLLAARDKKVVNLSGIGYGTDQEWLLLQRTLPLLTQPKLTILNFCLFNDFIDNSGSVNPHDGFRPKPYFTLSENRLTEHDEHLKTGAAYRLALFINQRSGSVYLLRRMLQSAGLLKPPKIAEGSFHFPTIYRAPTDEEWRNYDRTREASMPVTRALLSAFAMTVHKDLKSDLWIFLHPADYTPAAGDHHRAALQIDPPVRRFFQDLGIKVYDLGCHYEKAGLGFSEISTDRVGHLSAKGHEIVAGVVQSALENPAALAGCTIKGD